MFLIGTVHTTTLINDTVLQNSVEVQHMNNQPFTMLCSNSSSYYAMK